MTHDYKRRGTTTLILVISLSLMMPERKVMQEAMFLSCAGGQTLGYLPKDCFFRRAVHQEGRGCSSKVLQLHQGERGLTQVTIKLEVGGELVRKGEFSRRRGAVGPYPPEVVEAPADPWVVQ